MRSDPSKDTNFSKNKNWGEVEFELFTRTDKNGKSTHRSTAFSGNERNRLFFRNDDNFEDASLVSGIDYREDGRGFALLDFDNDGWVDIASVSPNQPRFRLNRNTMSAFGNSGRSVTVELVGGQSTNEPSVEWSSRDAYGAVVVATIGDQRRIFQLSCGEGLSSQNEKRIRIGMGGSPQIDELTVKWPSGKTSVETNVASGSRLEIRERK